MRIVPPAPAGGDIEMQALQQRIDELEIQWFNRGGRGGRGGGRGARGVGVGKPASLDGETERAPPLDLGTLKVRQGSLIPTKRFAKVREDPWIFM